MYAYDAGNDIWNPRGPDIDGEGNNDNEVVLNADGTIIAVGAYMNDAGGNNRARACSRGTAPRGTSAEDLDGDGDHHYQGVSVALSADGGVVVVGQSGSAGGRGNARVYAWDGDSWEPVDNDLVGENAGDTAGCAVGISADGSIVAVGAYTNDGNGGTLTGSGHVRMWAAQYRSPPSPPAPPVARPFTHRQYTPMGLDVDGENSGTILPRGGVECRRIGPRGRGKNADPGGLRTPAPRPCTVGQWQQPVGAALAAHAIRWHGQHANWGESVALADGAIAAVGRIAATSPANPTWATWRCTSGKTARGRNWAPTSASGSTTMADCRY